MWPPALSLKGELHTKCILLSFERAIKMLKNDMCINKIRQAVQKMGNYKFQIAKTKTKYCFASIKMENNRIREVIVDHFIMKKETICHISVIWDAEVMTLFAQSVRHIGNAITRFS